MKTSRFRIVVVFFGGFALLVWNDASHTAVAAQPPTPPLLLVFKKNVAEGTLAKAEDVEVREVAAHELEQYQRNKHKYMPPVVGAAGMRIVCKDVEANAPLLREHFCDGFFDVKDPARQLYVLPLRTEERNAIRRGNFVDILLTAKVQGKAGGAETRIFPIAKGLEVIAFRPPEAANQPAVVIVNVSAYRAGLIEHAKKRGTITIALAKGNSPAGPDEAEFASRERDLEAIFGAPLSKTKD